MKRVVASVVLALLASACGSSSGSSTNPPPTTSTNPCASVADEADQSEVVVPAEELAARRERKINVLDGNPRWRVFDALWTHREYLERKQRTPGERRTLSPRNSADVGEIAVLQDEGDLILPPNTYDLRSLGLRFTRNGSGGYNVARIDGNFRASLGTRLTLDDDDSAAGTMPFGFSFYGKGQTAVFVNSDGNLTFEDADKSSTERNVARLLTGPPRVAPFLADLDPTTGSGRVFLNAASDAYTVTWCNVRGFDTTRTVTLQTTLLPNGSIEMIYGATVNVGAAVVGLSPGRTGIFKPVNLSDAGPTDGGNGAVGERFAQDSQLDVVALTKKFFASHPDNYDQLVVWTDAPVITDAFAYETTVKNEIRGIGIDTYDLSADFGSGGRLRSLAVMDWLGKYPDNPLQKFLGENNTVSLMGQECGHRWLAFLEFLDRTRQRSDALLGRDLAHWSFFFDSDASVMEGNDIEDLGGGSFRTVGAVQRYSLLDQYAMGLVPDTAVPPFFYVESPTNMSSSRTRESAPEVGITFNGTRREVLIQDVVGVLGARSPSSADSARVHRQAFLYIVSAGKTADSGQVAKIDGIRRAWETFFFQATDRRMQAITTLR
ncbi:MAG TPA: hypothetical protein VFT39_25045 [Vicinamibacterales bacterium]|nr:hypothetical protein [Vicinamibacterales bacterium]